MDYDKSMLKQDLYSQLCLLGVNVNALSDKNPTLDQLAGLYQGIVKLMIESNISDVEGLRRVCDILGELYDNETSQR